MDQLRRDSAGCSSSLGKIKYNKCPHCKCELTYKKFKEHKKLFYNDATKTWAEDAANETDLIDFSEVDDFMVCSDKENESSDTLSDWEFSDSPPLPQCKAQSDPDVHLSNQEVQEGTNLNVRDAH